MPDRFDLIDNVNHELIEELDDEVRTQKEYFRTKLFVELVQDQILINDTMI
jgi:hypothetical protein